MPFPLRHRILPLLLCLVAAEATAAMALRDAWKAALARTETIPIQKAEVVQAEERVNAGTGRVLPNLSFQATYLRQDTPPAASTNAFTRPDQTAAKFTLVQPIFHGFGEWAELRSRRLLVQAASHTESWARLTIYGSVAESFYGVLAAEHDAGDLKALLELSEKRVEELRGRVRIGRSRRGELLSAESQVAIVKSQLDQSTGSIRQAREAFHLATNLPSDTELADDRELPGEVPATETFVARIAKRPDVEAARTRFESADAQIGVAEAGHWPGLDLTGNYYLKRTGILQDQHWDVGVQLVVPIFAGGSIQSQVREVVERRKATELQLALLKRQALRDVATFHSAVTSGLAQYRSLEEAHRLADANYREQTRDYRFGLVTNLEVIQALNSAYDAKRALSRTRYAVLTAWEKLRASTGELPGES